MGRLATARQHATIHSDAAQWAVTRNYPLGRVGATGALCTARARPANQQLINAGLLLANRLGAIRHTSM